MLRLCICEQLFKEKYCLSEIICLRVLQLGLQGKGHTQGGCYLFLLCSADGHAKVEDIE